MQFTRKQIIAYLQTHHIASVLELSKALNLTLGNIRHHIKDLENQKIVEEIGNLPTNGRGRPTKLYCLSKGALDHNLASLSAALLQIVMQGDLRKNNSDRIAQIAAQMIGIYEHFTSPIQRLNQTIGWLNERYYRSRWEASPTGPRIILGYCPYVAVLDTNPEICQIDTEIISQITQTKMRQITKLERGPQGSHQCVFVTQV